MTVCPHCYTDSATLAAQSAMIEARDQEIYALKRKLGLVEPLLRTGSQLGVHIAASEAAMLSLLLTRPRASKQDLLDSYKHHYGSTPDTKVVDVIICRLRKRIAPLGLVIDTIHGYGYCISRDIQAAMIEKLAA